VVDFDCGYLAREDEGRSHQEPFRLPLDAGENPAFDLLVTGIALLLPVRLYLLAGTEVEDDSVKFSIVVIEAAHFFLSGLDGTAEALTTGCSA